MRQVYTVIEKMKNKIKDNGITNTVTFGDILEVDLDKTTIYPLSHISIGDVIFNTGIATVTLQVFCLDIVDKTNDLTDEDLIFGNDNLQDVLNTQLSVVNDLQQELRRGSLFTDLLQITTEVTASPFLDNFENQLAGWSVTFNIEMANNEHTICESSC